MKVSILIPIYNVEKYIIRCLDTLFQQTYEELEYIFVDDASPDNSTTILRKVIEAHPHRSTQVNILIHSQNRGLAAARNSAIKAASGKYIYIVDSDDYIEPNTISLMVEEAEKSDADIVIGNFYIHTTNGTQAVHHQHHAKHEDVVMDILSLKNSHHVWNNLMRRSLFTEHHIQALEGVNYGEDHQIMTQAVYYAKKISFLDNFTYHYDYTNTASYIKSFYTSITEEKVIQLLKTARFIVSFFKDKEKIFGDQAQTLEFHYYYWVLSQLCLQGKRNEYRKIAKEFAKTDSKYWTLSKRFKPIFRKTVSSYFLMRIYLHMKHDRQ